MGDQRAPRLSIVIPTKDRPDLLAAAIGSALDSLPDDAEVIVVDDRSDLPCPVLRDARVRFTSSKATPGASGARNWGVAQARGHRILFLDDDDLLLPGYARWVVDQRADYGFSAIKQFAGHGNVPRPQFVAGRTERIATIPSFRHRLAGLGCGFWIDRVTFLGVGGLAEDIAVNEDTEFSIRLLRAGLEGLRSAEPGVMVRLHHADYITRGHLTHSASASLRASFFATILDRHADWLEENREIRRHLRMRAIKFLAKAGETKAAEKLLADVEPMIERATLFWHYQICRLVERFRTGSAR